MGVVCEEVGDVQGRHYGLGVKTYVVVEVHILHDYAVVAYVDIDQTDPDVVCEEPLAVVGEYEGIAYDKVLDDDGGLLSVEGKVVCIFPGDLAGDPYMAQQHIVEQCLVILADEVLIYLFQTHDVQFDIVDLYVLGYGTCGRRDIQNERSVETEDAVAVLQNREVHDGIQVRGDVDIVAALAVDGLYAFDIGIHGDLELAFRLTLYEA